MRNRNAVSCIVVTLFAIACGEQPTGLARDATTAAASRTASSGKPPTLSTVPLIVTVVDVDGSGTPYGIQSDGRGAYADGSESVQALLDQSGTFAFNTFNNGRKAAIRWVTYNFNNPVDPSNTYRPTPSASENYHFSTGASPFSPFIAIQNLGVNGNPTTECAYMGNGISNSTTSWRVSFHKGQEDIAASPTAFAVVTRTSVSPATWTVTPVGSCSPSSNVASLRSGDGSVLYGYYSLPFFLVLRAK